ncbi:hypothetical protein EYE42_12235 [Paracoccus subflavus]|uniref:Polysaccharide pyruvyl transferase domain-containing protein n=1 Tax=Paracoccus subflavus TaxID=2528244 RepID=A0A4Q9G347_9RHOB|nr:polysaccharide pyruvyl transferase family protein [Paracoccus subflavus]TBN38655.1 hypothetical protein EYE42_12235 [Paracoccus subflavus]
MQGSRGNASTWTVGLLPPTASGSLGDQAMVEAATEVLAARGRRVVIGLNNFQTRSAVSGPPGSHKLQVLAGLAGMAGRARHAGLIGADILDGVYNTSIIFKRFRILRMLHRCGVQTRVFGSSWSETPSERVIAFLRAAHWLHLHARDAISQSRMEAVLERPVRLVADLAFLLRPEICAPEAQAASRWIAARRAEGATLLGLNLAGLALCNATDDGIRAFATVVGDWLDADPRRAVVVMPHDARPGMVGDMLVLERLHYALQGRFAQRMYRVPATLDAWEMKALAGMVDLVVTGRMHLAIAAMGMGTPALCMVYQGKFEGLMDHFGITGLTMTLEDVLTGKAGPQLDNVTRRTTELAARLKARLPVVLDLSRKNFEGM